MAATKDEHRTQRVAPTPIHYGWTIATGVELGHVISSFTQFSTLVFGVLRATLFRGWISNSKATKQDSCTHFCSSNCVLNTGNPEWILAQAIIKKALVWEDEWPTLSYNMFFMFYLYKFYVNADMLPWHCHGQHWNSTKALMVGLSFLFMGPVRLDVEGDGPL